MEPEPPVAAKVGARPGLLNRKSADGRQDSRVTIPIEAALAPAMVDLLGSSRMRTKGSIIMTATPPLAALKGCRVLVVEDEFFQAKDLARALSEAGAVPVGPVPSFRDAVEALERNDVIDAAVLDINLRGQMAYEVADVLASRGIPFLFATGYDPELLPEAHRDRPIYEKPFRMDYLLAGVARLCAQSAAKA